LFTFTALHSEIERPWPSAWQVFAAGPSVGFVILVPCWFFTFLTLNIISLPVTSLAVLYDKIGFKYENSACYMQYMSSFLNVSSFSSFIEVYFD